MKKVLPVGFYLNERPTFHMRDAIAKMCSIRVETEGNAAKADVSFSISGKDERQLTTPCSNSIFHPACVPAAAAAAAILSCLAAAAARGGRLGLLLLVMMAAASLLLLSLHAFLLFLLLLLL